jgi:ankyrin repeat protein
MCFWIGVTDIVKATEGGQLKDVIYLIETGSSPNQKDVTNEKNLLLIAIEQEHYDIVKYLFEIGADVNANANTSFLGNYLNCKIKNACFTIYQKLKSINSYRNT